MYTESVLSVIAVSVIDTLSIWSLYLISMVVFSGGIEVY